MRTPKSLKTKPSAHFSTSADDDGQVFDSLGKVPIGETDNLDETVLGSAALGNPHLIPAEIAIGTETITEWDEVADEAGTWTPRDGRDDEMLDAARLVEAGIEEADRERRMAAGEFDA